MATQKKKNPQVPEWTLTDVYDLIMLEIEPELATGIMPYLDQIHESETEEERKERMERYEKAFEECGKRFEKLSVEWKDRIQTLKRAIRGVEQEEAEEEEAREISAIEEKFDTP